MPYAEPVKKRAYQRAWVAQRRAEWLAGRRCEACDSTRDLELHHVDPSQKVSHKLWSWSIDRREEELAKCVVLCRSCHTRSHAGSIRLAEERARARREEERRAAADWLAEWDRRRAAKRMRRDSHHRKEDA